ncbi:MAG: M20/M25/M40 family metallo-hydrolase [Bryobacterales bacterium]|nr:M20/M25/M40 family metallo-hydrolase [Bryobacterales bacterium]
MSEISSQLPTTQSSLAVEAPIETLDAALRGLEPSLLATLRDLVGTRSQNIPPHGEEVGCQRKIASALHALGHEADLYDLTEVPSLAAHPEFWPGRSYADRPNLNARIRGSGGGRSLILSGHIDTVPADTPVPWTRSPWGEDLEDGRLYGRGAWDMKAGVAMNLTILRALHRAGIRLKGDLTFETVVDEEFGGANGTLAARVRGYTADAAVIGESTGLSICPAQRGGRTAHVTLFGPGGILGEQQVRARVVDQLQHVLSRIDAFQQRRKLRVAIDPYFANSTEPFAVWVTNIATGKWGWVQPLTVPERCQVEIYWQAMPQETQEEVEREFHAWWRETIAARPELFPVPPAVCFPMRWLPGCSIPASSPLVVEFSAVAEACDVRARVEGLDAPSDMYIFQNCFDIPAIMWGPEGGGAHQADEFVDLASLVKSTRVLAQFVCRWCGVESAA